MTTGPLQLKTVDSQNTADAENPTHPMTEEPSRAIRRLRWLLPIAAIGFAVLVFWALLATKTTPVKIDPKIPSPLVRVVTAQPESLRLTVIARGTVTPRTESDLVAEVRGRVIEGSRQLVEGGFFDAGDVLLRLDDREHRIARDRGLATVKLRESEARLAEADAGRRRELASRGAASEADLEQFESRELVASAALQEARAALRQAELDLERTVVRAPFDGRVRERNVDIGQFVAPGDKLGRIFAVDYSEVRLPVRVDELGFLDTALDFGGSRDGKLGAPVILSATIAGRELKWAARIERAEAAIDAQTRMWNLVARVDDPYALKTRSSLMLSETLPEMPPETSSETSFEAPEPTATERIEPRMVLPPGLFVTAEIQGRFVEGVFVLPMMALRDGDRVFVFDTEGRLRVRDVSVVRRDRDRVVIEAGIEAGEQIVVSPLRIYSEGMALRAFDENSS